MIEFLQGTWLKHPLHPILAHIPTALWPAALFFDLLTRFGIGGNALVRTATYAILVGLIVAVAAMPPGLADWSGIKRDRPAWRIGLIHMALNVTATILWAINLFLRRGDHRDAAAVANVPLALSIAGTLILLVAGYLGGRLVYDYGISVARSSKEEWRRIAESGGARVPSSE